MEMGVKEDRKSERRPVVGWIGRLRPTRKSADFDLVFHDESVLMNLYRREKQMTVSINDAGASSGDCLWHPAPPPGGGSFAWKSTIKSRMTGDCHVRFCEQLRGEIPLG